MRIHRRTAAWIAVGAVALSAAGAGWRFTRPDVLRRELLSLLRGTLAGGWDAEVDSVGYDLLEGRATVEGIRLLRTSPGREEVVKVARVEAEVSFAALLGHGRLASEVRIRDPEVLIERGADGRWVLEGAFRPGAAGGAGGTGDGGAPAHPRVVVSGGTVRLRDPTLLAAGGEIRFRIEDLSVEEASGGRPAGIQGSLVEEGSPGSGGDGALGRVRISGTVPPGRQGLRAAFERFSVDDRMLARLAPGVRESLAPYRFSGPFGGDGAPGLEIVLSGGAEGEGIRARATARPRGLAVHLADFDYPFTGVAGEVTWDGGEGTLVVRSLELLHGASRFQAVADLDLSSPDAPFEIRFGARNLLLDAELHDALPPAVRRVWDSYAFRGVVDVATATDIGDGTFKSFVRRREKGGRVEVDVTAQLVDAGLSYKGVLGKDGVRHGFDWPVDRVTGEVSLRSPVDADGATSILLQGVRGRHGDTEVTAEGSVIEWPERRSKVDITLEAKDVPLDASVRDCSPVIADLFRRFGPRGRLSNLQVRITQEALPGAPTLATVVGEFDGKGGMTWEHLPIPVEGISGTVAYRERLLNGRKAVIVEITGVRGTDPMGAAVFADGTVEGEGDAELHLRVRADALLLDGPLEQALREAKVGDAVRLWGSLGPSGPVDLVLDVTGPSSKPRPSFSVALRGAYLEGWGEVRFPVADLTGTLEISGDRLRLLGVRGVHAGREVTLGGQVEGLSGDARFDLSLATTGFPLDESARGILGPSLSEGLGGYFTTVAPAPGLAGDVTVRLRGPGSALEPSVDLEKVAGGAAPLGLRDFAFRGGTVRYADGVLALEEIRGALGDRELRLPRGSLRLGRGEGDMVLEVRRLRFPGDLEGLLPAETTAAIEAAVPGRILHLEGLRVSLSEGWRRLELNGGVSLSPRAEGESRGVGFEGDLRLDRLSLRRGEGEGDPTEISGGLDIARGSMEAGVAIRDLSGRLDLEGSLGRLGRGLRGSLAGVRARVAGRELRDAGGELLLRDGVFLVKSLRGNLAGGDVGVSVEIGGQREFDGVVTLSNARAREFLAPTDPASPIEGQVEATLRFRKPREAPSEVIGDGRVDIKNGRLFQVPLFTGIVNLLRIADPPEFTAGQLVFAVKGDKLTFSRLDLDSSVLGIHLARGRSAAFADGRLDLKLLPEFKTGGILGLPFDVIGLFTQPIFERIYTIYVRGTVQRPEVSFEVLPGLFAGDLKDGPVLLPPPPAFPVSRRAPWEF